MHDAPQQAKVGGGGGGDGRAVQGKWLCAITWWGGDELRVP